MLLFYVRHGQPVYNPDSLTPLGQRQAEAIAKRLALYGLDRVCASSSNRAIQTARPTCDVLGLEMEILDWCNESHAWETLTRMDETGTRRWLFQDREMIPLLTSPGVRALGEEWYTHPALNDERYRQGMQRIRRETRAFLSGLGYDYDEARNLYRCTQPSEARIALFAHQGFGLAFLSALLGVPYPELCIHFDMGHSGMTVIEFADCGGVSVPRVLTLSDDAHIYREGLPTKYQGRLYF